MQTTTTSATGAGRGVVAKLPSRAARSRRLCWGGGGFLMRTTTVGFTELDTEHFCVNCPQLEGEEEAQLVLETSGGKAEKQFLLST